MDTFCTMTDEELVVSYAGGAMMLRLMSYSTGTSNLFMHIFSLPYATVA